MSRLGKTPIPVPKGVEVVVEKGEVRVKGARGVKSFILPEGLQVVMEGDKLSVILDESNPAHSRMHGFARASINNLIVGVSAGFEKKLSLVGVGYRAAIQGDKLDLQLGYSHPTHVMIPAGVKVEVDKSVSIKITGTDKQLVGQFAAEVRSVRPPEPYKGKGVRYENEVVRKKAGKTAKGK